MKSKHELWFKRRRYGWGWTPTTWQGWLVVTTALLIMIADVVFATSIGERPTAWQVTLFLAILAIAVVGLVAVGYRRGPKPKWRSGSRPDDNPDLDA